MSFDIDFDFDRLSQEDLLCYDILDVEEYYDVGQLKDNIHDILRFLNYYDLDLIYLTFLAKKKQVDLARILDQTQPSISYNLSRIRRQIQFVYFFLANIDNVVNFLRETKDFDLLQKQMLLVFFYSLTPTKASQVFNMHPITFKNKLGILLQKLKSINVQLYQIFDYIYRNFNKIKKTPIAQINKQTKSTQKATQKIKSERKNKRLKR